MFLFLFTLALSAQTENESEKKVDITIFEAFQKFFGSVELFFAHIFDSLSFAFSPILPPIVNFLSSTFGFVWKFFYILFSEIGTAIKYWQMALIQFIKKASSFFQRPKYTSIPASTPAPSFSPIIPVNPESDQIAESSVNEQQQTIQSTQSNVENQFTEQEVKQAQTDEFVTGEEKIQTIEPINIGEDHLPAKQTIETDKEHVDIDVGFVNDKEETKIPEAEAEIESNETEQTKDFTKTDPEGEFAIKPDDKSDQKPDEKQAEPTPGVEVSSSPTAKFTIGTENHHVNVNLEIVDDAEDGELPLKVTIDSNESDAASEPELPKSPEPAPAVEQKPTENDNLNNNL